MTDIPFPPNKYLPPDILSVFAQKGCAGNSATITGVRLQQKGVMRLAPDKPWAPFTARQVIRSQRVEFEWSASVKLALLLWAQVIDAYRGGGGRLRASLWGLIPVANARGPGIDRGEIQRYLAELPWCPAAILHNPDLHFRSMGEDRVRVWHGEEQTYVDLYFDDKGDIVSTRSDTREREGVGPQPWIGVFEDYRQIGGVRIPQRATVRWETPSGPFEYWKGEIVSVEVLADKQSDT